MSGLDLEAMRTRAEYLLGGFRDNSGPVNRCATDLLHAIDALQEAEGLLRDTADELDRWGWGDMHYGPTTRSQRVIEAVSRARAFLASTGDTEQEAT